MRFIKSSKEERLFDRIDSANFYDVETLSVVWETKQEIAERLLPPPLEPFDKPIARAYVCEFPKTNFGISYYETALMLVCKYKGEVGVYILAMHVNNDMAMALGREMFGYPKKMAEIEFKRGKLGASGWGKRQGVKVVEIASKIMKTISAEEAVEMQLGPSEGEDTVFAFKHFPAHDGDGFDYPPRLISSPVAYTRRMVRVGPADIKFQPSKYDPWHEIEVVKMVGAIFTVANTSMLRGKVLAEAEADTFKPYSYLKWDS
ncbi:MAG: acetoacetate decarboxylase family protein [Candidatus Thorarchaeota archaeon]